MGSIIQTYEPNVYITKGDEKGYFKFGGSTIIMMFQKNKMRVDSDIIHQTKKGIETEVFMGEKIGCKIK